MHKELKANITDDAKNDAEDSEDEDDSESNEDDDEKDHKYMKERRVSWFHHPDEGKKPEKKVIIPSKHENLEKEADRDE